MANVFAILAAIVLAVSAFLAVKNYQAYFNEDLVSPGIIQKREEIMDSMDVDDAVHLGRGSSDLMVQHSKAGDQVSSGRTADGADPGGVDIKSIRLLSEPCDGGLAVFNRRWER